MVDDVPQPLNSEELNPDENILLNHDLLGDSDPYLNYTEDPVSSDADLDEQSVVANDYRIKLGDIIKFGRISYKITQLYLPQVE